MEWYSGAIPDAISESKKNNKLLLVYIEGSDEISRSMTATYNDSKVVEKFSAGRVIALKLAHDSVSFQQFSAIFPVLVIPTSYFISSSGTPIEVITGSMTPDAFCDKVDSVFQLSAEGSSAAGMASGSSVASASTDERTSTSQSNQASPEPSADEKVERARRLIEAQRQAKAAEENEKEKQEEISRRSVGKAMQEAEKAKKDREMTEWAQSRAKEKEEERLARERVKAMIAQDRADRAAKYENYTAGIAEQQRQEQLQQEEERARADAELISYTARIQFRLPDGSNFTHSFSADDPLSEARLFVLREVRPPFSNFTLCTPYPRRHFTDSNYSESLQDLQLTPTAVLLILPAQSVSRPEGGRVNFLTEVFWVLMSPITAVWNLVRSLFGGSSGQEAEPPRNSASSADRREPQNPVQGPNRPSAPERRADSFAMRDGNIHRINNQSDDDDENNTYNGNSTQQM